LNPSFSRLSSGDFPQNSPPVPAVALTIAGHDPSSGAGITADLQVFAAHRLFGTSAVTALTVQSTLGVKEIRPISANFLRQALEHLHADIPTQGIKIGMIGSPEGIQTITSHLQALHSGNRFSSNIPIVLDPILSSSSGADLTGRNDLRELHQLLPAVSWITPNWAELCALTGLPVATLDQAEAATAHLGRRYPNLYIVATAGDSPLPTDLLRLPDGKWHSFPGQHIDSTSTHGTGCAFSSALLSRLILGDPPEIAVAAAKTYVTESIRRAPKLGHGRGPLNLLWPLTSDPRTSPL